MKAGIKKGLLIVVGVFVALIVIGAFSESGTDASSSAGAADSGSIVAKSSFKTPVAVTNLADYQELITAYVKWLGSTTKRIMSDGGYNLEQMVGEWGAFLSAIYTSYKSSELKKEILTMTKAELEKIKYVPDIWDLDEGLSERLSDFFDFPWLSSSESLTGRLLDAISANTPQDQMSKAKESLLNMIKTIDKVAGPRVVDKLNMYFW